MKAAAVATASALPRASSAYGSWAPRARPRGRAFVSIARWQAGARSRARAGVGGERTTKTCAGRSRSMAS
eukprot:scaffold5027_cov255-Prasinococcus_capsulatus_cf.AAC.6